MTRKSLRVYGGSAQRCALSVKCVGIRGLFLLFIWPIVGNWPVLSKYLRLQALPRGVILSPSMQLEQQQVLDLLPPGRGFAPYYMEPRNGLGIQ
jgi:hypothetical protein